MGVKTDLLLSEYLKGENTADKGCSPKEKESVDRLLVKLFLLSEITNLVQITQLLGSFKQHVIPTACFLKDREFSFQTRVLIPCCSFDWEKAYELS